MRNRTISETLFEQFCTETNIPYVRLEPDPASGQRTPDYELHLQDPPILVEVKQIDPNQKDKAFLRAVAEVGKSTGGGRVIRDIDVEIDGECGHRIRKKISKANPQLKARARQNQPTLVVVYNDVDPLLGYTDLYEVMSAMYGLPQAVITTTRGIGACTVSVVHRLGGERSMTPKHNTTISALAVLFDGPGVLYLKGHEGPYYLKGPKGPYLVVYHNQFAAVPIQPEVLRQHRIHQFCIQKSDDNRLPQWSEL